MAATSKETERTPEAEERLTKAPRTLDEDLMNALQTLDEVLPVVTGHRAAESSGFTLAQLQPEALATVARRQKHEKHYG